MNAGNDRKHFIAGNLALDFVNTVAYRFHPEKMEDRFRSAEDVRRWADQARLPDRGAIGSRLPIARSALLRLRAVRENLFAIFHRIAQSQPIPSGALHEIDVALAECSAQRHLSVRDAAVRWAWRSSAISWHVLLYPVLTAAVDLLTSDARSSIRRCADSTCGWLFLDRSNAGKRRWCSMADCGNKSKAREYYRRRKRALPAPSRPEAGGRRLLLSGRPADEPMISV